MRETNTITATEFDIVVVGGGIYGMITALEASLMGVRVLLVEREELGCGTTKSWLRILHGGLRYLQFLDIKRFFESVAERRWFLQHFSEFCVPLQCLMPLYQGRGPSRLLMAPGLFVNDVLSLGRNAGMPNSVHINQSRVVSKHDVLDLAPFVNSEGLLGGASWYDGHVLHPDRLIDAIKHWSTALGALVLTGYEATGLLTSNGRVTVTDAKTGRTTDVTARIVVNATGHQVPQLAKSWGDALGDVPKLSWAWNVLFDIDYPYSSAVAVSAPADGSQTLFVLPWKGKTLVGTGNQCIPDSANPANLPDEALNRFVLQAQLAAPGLGLNTSRIEEVMLGWMPVVCCDPIEYPKRPLLKEHSASGLQGLYSIWGIKYTTARREARRVLKMAFPNEFAKGVHYDRRFPVRQ